jgi:hypothetical protein
MLTRVRSRFGASAPRFCPPKNRRDGPFQAHPCASNTPATGPIPMSMSQSHTNQTYPWKAVVIIDARAGSAPPTLGTAVSSRCTSNAGVVDDERATPS